MRVSNYYEQRIASLGLKVGMCVGIGNGTDGEIVRLSCWSQGVCVKVDDARMFVWCHYEDVIPREGTS